MQNLRAQDPAELLVAWEAVEELLTAIPEGATKDVLRMFAAGFSAADIGEALHLCADDVEALAARGRVRLLTAAIDARRT